MLTRRKAPFKQTNKQTFALKSTPVIFLPHNPDWNTTNFLWPNILENKGILVDQLRVFDYFALFRDNQHIKISNP